MRRDGGTSDGQTKARRTAAEGVCRCKRPLEDDRRETAQKTTKMALGSMCVRDDRGVDRGGCGEVGEETLVSIDQRMLGIKGRINEDDNYKDAFPHEFFWWRD